MTLAFVSEGASVQQLAQVGMAPGLLSPGLGTVPRQQTYLDVSQGNRIFSSLYDRKLPALKDDCPNWWKAVTQRADSAPADIVPGLLTSTLEAADLGVLARGEASCTFSPHSSQAPATSGSTKKLSETPGQHAQPQPALEVREAKLSEVSREVTDLRSGDLLIAISRPSGRSDALLAIGIAGEGYGGNLTSGSTRTDGYVLSTDIAPTILAHLGIAVPAPMAGQPIRDQASVDVAAIESRGERMGVISQRRGPVIGLSLLAWVLALAAVVGVSSGALARPAVRVAGLTVVYLPLVLLAAAAIEPAERAELLLAMLGAPLLAVLTLALLGGYRALAVAAGLTVGATALDMIAGSPLTSLSLLGPNPGLGVRFYGIGNELEALLAVLVVAGTGAGLAGFLPDLDRRRAAAVFVAVGLLAAFVFAAGRFGADVGAAIVLPLGAAVAAVAIAGRGRRLGLLAIIAAPFAVVALLALIDLLSGANAHLTRSVLDAGGLGELADVAQRRLQLSARSFGRPVLLAFLPVVAIIAALAYWRRDRLRAWVAAVPAVRAGLLGALAATVVGTLANDSGALLLEIGAAYLLVFTGFAWAESSTQTKSYDDVPHASQLSS